MSKSTTEVAADEATKTKGFSIPQTAPLIVFLLVMVVFSLL